jgi:serine/threonine protein kinase
MGKVYRVEDRKIKEEIALKLIKPEIASDKKTIERFSNELKIARKIRHKNVCGMYDLNEEKGTHYITMEYVPGEDLKSLVRRVKFDIGTSIKIAKQICEGLSEAHRLGVIHRDLKPSNIMIDKEGNARIMDFGIARSLSSQGITGAGIMIGTPEYMSPEQVEGKEVDPRSDIYSFGVVLYEMVTGRLPFEGDAPLSIAVKHKSEEPPDPRELNAQIPEDLSRLILKCMEKENVKRYQSAGEVSAALSSIEGGISATEKEVPRRKPMTLREITAKFSLKKLFIPALVFVALAILISISVVIINRLPSEKPFLPTHKQLTYTGNTSSPAISPDGKFIAYANQESFDEQAIFVQDIVSEHSIEVFRMMGCLNLRWTPDSSQICVSGRGLDSNMGLFIIPRLGGRSRKAQDFFPYFTWSPDGTQFAGAYNIGSKEIEIVDKATGDIKSIHLTGDFTWLSDIEWSPLGHLILFLTNDKEKYTIRTINTDGSNQQKVVEESRKLSSTRWSPEGDAIFYLRGEREKELLSIRVSPDAGKPLKSPSLVLPALQAGPSFSFTSDGKKLVYTRKHIYSNLWLTTFGNSGDSSAIETKQLTTGTLLNYFPSISPDGRQIVFSRGDGEKSNIYVMPIEGGSPTQITFMDSYNTSPVWSPDGKHIAFACKEDEAFNVWKVSVQGRRPFQFTESEISLDTPWITWSPGENILYQRPGNRNFHILNPETGEEVPLVQDESVGWIFFPIYSPDRKRVAVHWNHKDGPGLWVISLDDSSSFFIKKDFLMPIGWSADGKWVYSYKKTGGTIKIFMVEIESGQERTVLTIPFTFELGDPDFLCMSPGGKHFVIPVTKVNSDVWLIENFDSKTK